MIKAINIRTEESKCGKLFHVRAAVKDIGYQKAFDYLPSSDEVNNAVKSFEVNYGGLNESTNKPVKAEIHHTEMD